MKKSQKVCTALVGGFLLGSVLLLADIRRRMKSIPPSEDGHIDFGFGV